MLIALILILSAQTNAEYSVSKTTHSNYINAFNKKYQYLNNTLRIISGESIKGGTFAAYIRNPLLVLSGLIMDKYKKILFTDIKGDTFIVNNVKWLYQYVYTNNHRDSMHYLFCFLSLLVDQVLLVLLFYYDRQ